MKRHQSNCSSRPQLLLQQAVMMHRVGHERGGWEGKGREELQGSLAHPGGRNRSSRGRSSGGRSILKAAELPRTAGRPSTAPSSRSEFTAVLSISDARPLTFCALHNTKVRLHPYRRLKLQDQTAAGCLTQHACATKGKGQHLQLVCGASHQSWFACMPPTKCDVTD